MALVAVAAQASDVVAAAPSADHILAQAVARAEECRDARANYAALHRNVTFELGEDPTRSLYRVRPTDDEPFYELIERDGEPATEADLRAEARRRERFRRQVGEAGHAFAVDASTLERYAVEFVGRETVQGRPAWKLAFSPTDEEKPAPRRIDEVLNRTRGALWIDVQDHGVARVDFSLAEPLRLWAGLFGALTEFEGTFEQVRVSEGVWLPYSLRLEMDGWAPFSSLERRVELDWSDYERVEQRP
ncbi:MAG: hypothetical protein R2724_19215 [Bryobacterales bacterium]